MKKKTIRIKRVTEKLRKHTNYISKTKQKKTKQKREKFTFFTWWLREKKRKKERSELKNRDT